MGYGFPVRVPMIDIHTIGAGGGSIARVNAAGILQVGPESAGAAPDPSATAAAARNRRRPMRTCARPAEPGGAARRRRGRPHARPACARSSTRRSARTSGSTPDEVASAIVRGRERQDGRRDPHGVARSAATIRATSCCSRSAAPGRSTPWRSRASWRSRRCSCRRGPASPRRSAASWPTSATTSCRRSTRTCCAWTSARRGRSWPRQVDEGRRLLASEGVEVETRRPCSTRPTCSTSARLTC